ncbi:MAG: hypothetical protein P8I91_03780 [Phycisphaerales bacterium]|nr:hypothetical protein [Phycisphaerales bacterium]
MRRQLMMIFACSAVALAAVPTTSAQTVGRYPDLVQEADSDDAIAIYIVPMRGQIGTDILPDLYEPIIEDIKEIKPDMIVFHIDSHDYKDVDDETVDIMENTGRPGQSDGSYPALKPMAELRQAFHDELGDIEQVCYVEDAQSVASLLALSWKTIYIDPDGELGGAVVPWMRMAAPVMNDSQKYGKYLRAIMGDVRGIVQYGGWDDADKREFISALVVPEEMASTTWRGRDAIWYRDGRGDFVVDPINELPSKPTLQSLLQATINLSGEQAEKLLVVDGTASPDRFVKDILAQLGHRRYQIVGHASDQVEAHRTAWRKSAKRARDNFMLFTRMNGGQYMYQLQAALKAISSYISAIKTDQAVRTRMQLERLPTNTLQLDMMREQLKETIRRRKQGGAGGGGGRGGGGGGLGGPGGM